MAVKLRFQLPTNVKLCMWLRKLPLHMKASVAWILLNVKPKHRHICYKNWTCSTKLVLLTVFPNPSKPFWGQDWSPSSSYNLRLTPIQHSFTDKHSLFVPCISNSSWYSWTFLTTYPDTKLKSDSNKASPYSSSFWTRNASGMVKKLDQNYVIKF